MLPPAAEPADPADPAELDMPGGGPSRGFHTGEPIWTWKRKKEIDSKEIITNKLYMKLYSEL